jgi:hypothetical protein
LNKIKKKDEYKDEYKDDIIVNYYESENIVLNNFE